MSGNSLSLSLPWSYMKTQVLANCLPFKTRYTKSRLVITVETLEGFGDFLENICWYFSFFIISAKDFTDSVSVCEKLHLHRSAHVTLWVRLWVHLFLWVSLRLQRRRPRLSWRERRSVTGTMDYQQKLAEKLVILNERGNGVLIRMNYIKKVRASRKSHSLTAKRETRPIGALFFG